MLPPPRQALSRGSARPTRGSKPSINPTREPRLLQLTGHTPCLLPWILKTHRWVSPSSPFHRASRGLKRGVASPGSSSTSQQSRSEIWVFYPPPQPHKQPSRSGGSRAASGGILGKAGTDHARLRRTGAHHLDSSGVPRGQTPTCGQSGFALGMLGVKPGFSGHSNSPGLRERRNPRSGNSQEESQRQPPSTATTAGTCLPARRML